MKPVLRVTVEEVFEDDGEAHFLNAFHLTDGLDSYVVICGPALYVDHVQTYSNGTKIVTIKKDDDNG